MTETFSRYDAADYLKTAEDIAAYLEASAEENDPAQMALALGAVARAGNMSQLARDAGMTREGVYKALSADGNPSFATITKIARALGLRMRFEAAGE
jgi:probable addiction module antidote protein